MRGQKGQPEVQRLARHLSIKEAAQTLGVPESTFRTWVCIGLIPRVKFPGKKGRVLVRESDLVEVLDRLREPSCQEIVGRVLGSHAPRLPA